MPPDAPTTSKVASRTENGPRPPRVTGAPSTVELLRSLRRSSTPRDVTNRAGSPSSGRGPRPWPVRLARGAAFVVLGLYAALALAVAADRFSQAGKVYPAVSVLRVPAGGMDPLEVAERLRVATDGGGLAKYRFVIDDELPEPDDVASQSFIWRGRELGVDFDILESARRAYAVGREGSLRAQTKDRLQSRLAAAGLREEVKVEPDVSYRPRPARLAVEEMAQALHRPPKDAELRIPTGQLQNGLPGTAVSSAAPGFAVDKRGTLARLEDALSRLESEVELSTYEPYPDIPTSAAEEAAGKARMVLSGNPLVIDGPDRDYDLAPAEQADWLRVTPVPEKAGISVDLDTAALEEAVEPCAADVARAPEDASLYVDSNRDGVSRVQVSPGKPGREARTRELLNTITRDLFGGRKSYKLGVNQVEPNRTTADVEAVKPDRLLGGYKTGYQTGDENGGPEADVRYAKISEAAAALDGTLIPPGDSFSLRQALEGAGIYPEELQSPDEGSVFDPSAPRRPPVDDTSGLSQVSSTVYAAALLSGVAIPERSPSPAAPLPYIDPGLEAYLGPEGDLVLENDTAAYLFLQVTSDDAGRVDARIFGRGPSEAGASSEAGDYPADSLTSEELDAGDATERWQASRTLASGDQEVLHEDSYFYEPVESEAEDPRAEEPAEEPEPADNNSTGQEGGTAAENTDEDRDADSDGGGGVEPGPDDPPAAGSDETTTTG